MRKNKRKSRTVQSNRIYREHMDSCPLSKREAPENPQKATKELLSFSSIDITNSPEWSETSLAEFIQRADCIIDQLDREWYKMNDAGKASLVLAVTALYQLSQRYAIEFGHLPFHRMPNTPRRTRLINGCNPKPGKIVRRKQKLAKLVTSHEMVWQRRKALAQWAALPRRVQK